MIGQSVSHYRIVEKLGGGGMGVVYGAEDTRLGRRVALKFLPEGSSRDRAALQRFLREGRAASALNHPNICTVHDIGEHEGRPFFVMELVRGEQLGECISGRPFSTDRLLHLGIQIADALRAAHSEGIVHRDIKPSNIIVTKEGNVKVVDFGLAKLVRPSGGAGSEAPTVGWEERDLTASGAAVGTVSYMSPEQVRGQDVDFRTDIFSLGAVLYEMATGRRAFPANTVGIAFEAILNRAPVSPIELRPDLPEEVERIINKALEKDPDLRYQSAADLRTDLKRLRRDTESRPSGERRGAVAAPSPRRSKALYGAVALALVALVAGALTLLRDRLEPPPTRSEWVRLTDFTDSATSPALSPDGRMLTFLRGAPGRLPRRDRSMSRCCPTGRRFSSPTTTRRR